MRTVLGQVGGLRFYTKLSYQEAHNGRTPEEDNVSSESVEFPDGVTREVYKAWGQPASHGTQNTDMIHGMIR